jgi:hypothetical protein
LEVPTSIAAIYFSVLHRSVELALILAIATVQCVPWARVDDARQQSRDGRIVVGAAAQEGGGTARVKATSAVILFDAVSRSVLVGAPAVSAITLLTGAPASGSNSFVEFSLSQRPPPPAL